MKAREFVIAVCAIGVFLVPPVLAAANPFMSEGSTFCDQRKPVRDFGLSGLPPVREAPESLKGLGYGAVTMYGGWDRVMSEPYPFGYGFSERRYDGSLPLDWTVSAQLWAIDRRGSDLEEVDRDELFIGRLSAASQPKIEVHPPEDRRGFYRFDMQIVGSEGREIASYSAHFKVVQPSWRPRLRLNRTVVRAGERLLARLENLGSRTVSYGESFGVERRDGGTWTPARDLLRGRWLMWLGLLGPGGSGKCNSLSIPPDTPPGSYRIVKGVGSDRWPKGREERLVAPFKVVEAGADIEY